MAISCRAFIGSGNSLTTIPDPRIQGCPLNVVSRSRYREMLDLTDAQLVFLALTDAIDLKRTEPTPPSPFDWQQFIAPTAEVALNTDKQ